jgi:hypothetical protein
MSKPSELLFLHPRSLLAQAHVSMRCSFLAVEKLARIKHSARFSCAAKLRCWLTGRLHQARLPQLSFGREVDRSLQDSDAWAPRNWMSRKSLFNLLQCRTRQSDQSKMFRAPVADQGRHNTFLGTWVTYRYVISCTYKTLASISLFHALCSSY